MNEHFPFFLFLFWIFFCLFVIAYNSFAVMVNFQWEFTHSCQVWWFSSQLNFDICSIFEGFFSCFSFQKSVRINRKNREYFLTKAIHLDHANRQSTQRSIQFHSPVMMFRYIYILRCRYIIYSLDFASWSNGPMHV